jgi:hypothetical protein
VNSVEYVASWSTQSETDVAASTRNGQTDAPTIEATRTTTEAVEGQRVRNRQHRGLVARGRCYFTAHVRYAVEAAPAAATAAAATAAEMRR